MKANAALYALIVALIANFSFAATSKANTNSAKSLNFSQVNSANSVNFSTQSQINAANALNSTLLANANSLNLANNANGGGSLLAQNSESPAEFLTQNSTNLSQNPSEKSSEISTQNSHSNLNEIPAKAHELGAVEVTATAEADFNPTATIISTKDIKDSTSANVAEALRMSPGVMFQNPRGGMGQSNVRVRGFTTSRLGFYLDGIPMMGAYDRYTDYTHFTTWGISSVQISKGFTSPIYGIGAMGGAINIVSKKPQKELEFSAHYKFLEKDEHRTSVSVGTNQGFYYLSLDYSLIDRKSYPLPRSFQATPAQKSGDKTAKYHNQAVKFKLGITPNENHEYELNYIYQRGKRSGVYPEGGGANWYFPHHDKQTIYLLGNSYFTPNLSLNSRLYYDSFHSERDINYCVRADGTLGLRYSGNGNPEARCNPLGDLNFTDKDSVLGAILSLNYDINHNAKITLGANVRKDHHARWLDVSGVKISKLDELTSSIFAQYAQRIDKFRFVLATSYDRVDTLNAFSKSGSTEDDTKIEIKGDFSLQGVLYYDIYEGVNLHLSVGKKQNLPTMANRYPNSNFGQYVQNPNLKPESVISYEFGYDINVQSTKISAAVFYDDKNNMIVSEDIVSTCATPDSSGKCTRYINAKEGYVYGMEWNFEQGFLQNALLVGVNYSYLASHNSANTKLTQYPAHMLNAKVAIKPTREFEFIALSTLQSPQYVNSAGTLEDSSYFTLDISANYELVKGLWLNLGVINLTDRENFVRWANPRGSRSFFTGRRLFVGLDYSY